MVEECDVEAFLQFKCPPETKVDGFGVQEIKYHKSNDCQRFFLCNEGRPRLFICGGGTSFDETLNRCEAAQNVSGCEQFAIKNETESNFQ